MTDPYSYLRPGAPRVPRFIRPLGHEGTIAIVGVSAYTLTNLLVNASYVMFDATSQANPAIAIVVLMSSFLFLVSAIAAYVALCLWMQAVRTRLSEAWYDVPPVWKIWAGWLIPFYSLVAPYLVMRDLRARVLWGSSGLLALWWIPFLVSGFISNYSSLSNPAGSPSTFPLFVSSALVIVSFVALVKIIRSTSSSLEPRAAEIAY